MKEIYVIYNINTGEIEGGSGKIDRSKDSLDDILRVLSEDVNLGVTFSTLKKVPSRATHQVINDKVVPRETPDVTSREYYEGVLRTEIRDKPIKDLIKRKELPEGYE